MRKYCGKATLSAVLLGALGLASCALPGIHRENTRKTPDAGRDVEAMVDARKAAALDAGPDSATPSDASVDAGPPPDPMMDPANRDEDFATFRTLVPPSHIYAAWPMPDNSPGAAVKPSYSATDTVVTDNVTQLRWQRVLPKVYPSCAGRYPLRGELQEAGTGCTWDEAKAFCARPELEEELGPGPWRLPTKIELESLIDVTVSPAFDQLFATYPTDFFWSASPSPNPDGLKLAWAVDFSEGYTYASGRYKAARVRCVSSQDENSGREPNYTIARALIEDRSTKLTWQQLPDSEARTWEQAVDYCDKLPLENGGWRLPTLKELLTIVDSSRHLPAVVPRAFTHTPNARFWTASKVLTIEVEDQAYQVDFAKGGVAYSSRTDELFTRCVR